MNFLIIMQPTIAEQPGHCHNSVYNASVAQQESPCHP